MGTVIHKTSVHLNQWLKCPHNLNNYQTIVTNVTFIMHYNTILFLTSILLIILEDLIQLIQMVKLITLKKAK